MLPGCNHSNAEECNVMAEYQQVADNSDICEMLVRFFAFLISLLIQKVTMVTKGLTVKDDLARPHRLGIHMLIRNLCNRY